MSVRDLGGGGQSRKNRNKDYAINFQFLENALGPPCVGPLSIIHIQIPLLWMDIKNMKPSLPSKSSRIRLPAYYHHIIGQAHSPPLRQCQNSENRYWHLWAGCSAKKAAHLLTALAIAEVKFDG